MAWFRRVSVPSGVSVTKLSTSEATGHAGVGGVKQRTGLMSDEFDRNLQGDRWLKVVREMDTNDSIVGSTLFLLRSYLQAAVWDVEPFDDTPAAAVDAEFLESCMDDMPEPFSAVTDDVWMMLPHGWSWLDVAYKPRRGATDDVETSSRFDDGKWGWASFAWRDPATWKKWEYGPNGRLVGWWQKVPGGGEAFLPKAKGLHFRTTRRGNRPDGQSVLRTAYRPWWFRKRFEEIEAIGVERDLAGLPVQYVAPETVKEAGTTLASYEQLVRDIRVDEQAGVVLPSVFDENNNRLVELKLLATAGARAFDTTKIIERKSREIAMTMLADVVMMGHERVGSEALASTKDVMLRRALQAWLDDTADNFNRDEIPRLFSLNGNTTGDLPRLTVTPPDDASTQELLDALASLAATGAPLWPNPELAEFVRTRTGVPVLDSFDEGFPEDVTVVSDGDNNS